MSEPNNRSPLAFLPVMLAAWRVLCDADFPLSLTGIEMRLVPELYWLAIGQPARQILEKALLALTALGLAERRGANYARLAPASQEEALSFKIQEEEEEELIKSSSSSSSCLTSEGTPATRAAGTSEAERKKTSAALKAAGILPHVRRELLKAFPDLTRQDVWDLEKYLKKEFPTQYSPGLLVFRLRQGERAPQKAWISQELQELLACKVCGEVDCVCEWEDGDEGNAGDEAAQVEMDA